MVRISEFRQCSQLHLRHRPGDRVETSREKLGLLKVICTLSTMASRRPHVVSVKPEFAKQQLEMTASLSRG